MTERDQAKGFSICPDCQKKISLIAKICPYCSRRRPQIEIQGAIKREEDYTVSCDRILKWVLGIILFPFIILCMFVMIMETIDGTQVEEIKTIDKIKIM